jgi:hypothetical protein
MSQFVAIPAVDIKSFLQAKGFTQGTQGNEITYVRRSRRNNAVLMKVYTSIPIHGTAVRAAGRDAIRVCVVFDNGQKTFGIGKFPPVIRVHSVQSVLDRLKIRLNEAAKRADQWIDDNDSALPPVAKTINEKPQPSASPTDDVPSFLAALC